MTDRAGVCIRPGLFLVQYNISRSCARGSRAEREREHMRTLVVNTIVGVILLFLTNLFLAEDIPINIITVVICAILGVVGWAIILILHLLGLAF